MTMAKKQLKQSETIEIKRSQINLNPHNPKRHGDKAVKEQKKNFQRVGFLGGVTWNKTTGNLIDGHRRIMAMDDYYGYPENDYTVKVEAVELDEKQEKEQMTYMALANTKADYQLIAEYLPDIDYSVAGVSDYDLTQIQSYLPTAEDTLPDIESFDDLISEPEEEQPEAEEVSQANTLGEEPTDEEKKAHVKEMKQKAIETAGERYQDLVAYITISFENAEQKRLFCEVCEINENDKFIEASKLMEMIQ